MTTIIDYNNALDSNYSGVPTLYRLPVALKLIEENTRRLDVALSRSYCYLLIARAGARQINRQAKTLAPLTMGELEKRKC
jgi:hypothetical protein